MNAKITCLSAMLLFTGAFAAGANAEYRCAPAPTAIDQRACEAAEQGPDALRRFVQRWDSQMSNLYFADYVDGKTEQSWSARSGTVTPEPVRRELAEMPQERVGA